MREVIAGKMWLGNFLDLHNLTKIHEAGIQAIVDLARDEKPAQPSRELIYIRTPIVDGSGNSAQRLALAIQSTATLISQGTPTIIACSAGMSRSPAILAAALALHYGKSPDSVLDGLIVDNPCDLSPTLWIDTKVVFQQLKK